MIDIIISWFRHLSKRNILLIIMFILFFLIMYFTNIQESFLSLSDNCKQYTSTSECLSHSNCGICLKNKKATCIEGNSDGPMYCGNCEFWKYKRRVGMGKNKNVVNITTRPWNNVFMSDKRVDAIALHS